MRTVTLGTPAMAVGGVSVTRPSNVNAIDAGPVGGAGVGTTCEGNDEGAVGNDSDLVQPARTHAVTIDTPNVTHGMRARDVPLCRIETPPRAIQPHAFQSGAGR